MPSTALAGRPGDGGRTTAAGRRVGRLVVAAQMAVAFALLVGTNLLGETLLRLHSEPLGFDASGLTLVTIRPPAGTSDGSVDRVQQARSIIDALQLVPGVTAAAGSGAAPFGGNFGTTRIAVDDEADRTRTTQQVAGTSDYLSVLRLPVVDGRGFEPADQTDERVAVVSQAFADRYLEGRAVGRIFRAPEPYRVIGVVENLKQQRLADENAIVFFALARHLPNQGVTQFVARAADPSSPPAIAAIRSAIQEVDRDLTVTSAARVDRLIWDSTADARFRAVLTTAFSVLALAIAAIGIYGVVSRNLARRRREIGIRLALGASHRRVRALILREAGLVVGVGLAAGFPVAVYGSRLIRAQLFGVAPGTIHVYLLAAAVLASSAVAAAWLPTRAAGRLAPAETLRDEQ